MSPIKERLLAAEVRPLLVADCCVVLERTVKATKGFKGIAVKSAFTTIKAIKPRFVEGVVDGLLDEWVDKLGAFEAEHAAGSPSDSLGTYLTAHKARVAEALLSVTDGRAETTKYKTAASIYRRLRPSALEHVEEGVPELAQLVDKYSSDPGTSEA